MHGAGPCARQVVSSLNTTTLQPPAAVTLEMSASNLFPILRFDRKGSDDVLLAYQLTPKEEELLEELEAATAEIDPDAELEAYYEVVIPIGARRGLSAAESIAFWTRTTLSSFEP